MLVILIWGHMFDVMYTLLGFICPASNVLWFARVNVIILLTSAWLKVCSLVYLAVREAATSVLLAFSASAVF